MAKKRVTRTKNFRLMGESILKGEKPANMVGFLEGANFNQSGELHNPTNPQLHKTTLTKLGRLHLQIRQDLIDRLLDEVFSRKRNPSISNRAATQRAVIEEALELFLAENPKHRG